MHIYLRIYMWCVHVAGELQPERGLALHPGRQWNDVPRRRCPVGGLRERHRWSGRSIGEFGACRGAMWRKLCRRIPWRKLWFFQCSLEMFGFLRILSVLVVLFDIFILFLFIFVGFAGAETLGYKKTRFSSSWRSFHCLKEHHVAWQPRPLLLRFAVLRTWRMHVGHAQSVFGQSMRHFSQHRTDIDVSQLDRVG